MPPELLEKILVHMRKGHGDDCKMETDGTKEMKSHMKDEHEREGEKLEKWRKSCKR